MASYSELLELALSDFVGTPIDNVDVSMIDPRRIDAASGLVHDPASWISPDDSSNGCLLLRVAGNCTSLETQGGDEELLVELASLLQDYVMDESSQAWPETWLHGTRRVLEPLLDDAGHAVWGHARSRTILCRVGQLRKHIS